MAIQSWQNIIDAIRNGEAVTAEVTNRAIYQLAQRTEHLKTRQDAQDYAQALFISDAPLRSDVATGHAVYFDITAGAFAPAYAELVYKDGYMVAGPASTVVGIVVNKDTTNSGVIVVEGLINPTSYTGIDCTGDDMTANMLVDQAGRGLMYLTSGASGAGRLSVRPGLLHVPVCNLIDDNHLLVRPPIAAPLETQALKFPLAARPAAPELILQRVSDGVTEAFPVAIAVGSLITLGTVGSGNPDSALTNIYLTAKVHSFNQSSGVIGLINVITTRHYQGLLAATPTIGSHDLVLKAPNGQELVLKVGASLTGIRISYGTPTVTSYIPLVTATDGDGVGYTLITSRLDATLPGWLPATSQYFPDVVIPTGAKYGYNFKADINLHQLFPEGVVGPYVIFKDGEALASTTAITASNGLWWFNNLDNTPWHRVGSGVLARHILPDTTVDFSGWGLGSVSNFMPPTYLSLVYAKLISGGIRVVTSIDTPADSPFTITDPDGNFANTGPLVVNAGFKVLEGSTTEAGYVVVKDITGFTMKRGRVVERLVAGTNITLDSVATGGQGEVTVSVAGLDGKLEGSPDILAIDDILIERDPNLSLFYSAMPPAKNSSILGKVDIPSYLQGTYNVRLVITFLALHASGSVQLPSIPLSWLNTQAPGVGVKYNLASGTGAPTSGTVSGGIAPFSSAVLPRDFFVASAILTTATPGGALFFRLARSAADGYTGKIGIMSIRYKFEKVTV